MIEQKKVYLLTGSNIEPRRYYLSEAKNLIMQDVGKNTRSSKIYESEPWGFETDVCFLNQVLIVETNMSPKTVLEKILLIEKRLGRMRIGDNYQSRTIDIDILYYDDEVIDSRELTVPHPRLHERNFTLLPLTEIAPEYNHPKMKLTNRELYHQTIDSTKVWKYEGN